jgi:hypothetical protein
MMDANPLLNSFHPIPTRMGSQRTITKHQHQLAMNFKGGNVLPIQSLTPQSFLYDNVSTIITTAHKLIPSVALKLIFFYYCQYLPPQNKRVVKKI